MPKALTWSLTICTYNRAHFLVETVRCALEQTRRPFEIVIVDASDDWEASRLALLSQFAEVWGDVALVHVPAKVRSLPFQRNQALGLARGDIVFSLDDDIYLYPDAAEIIMRGYEADEDEKIAMIGGHFTHGPYEADAPASQEIAAPPRRGLRAWLEEQLSLESHFVPYGPNLDQSAVPSAVEGTGILSAGLINGGRSTFRRTFGDQVKWSEFLRYYATHEDGDFSYRMSLKGRLLNAPKAGFFHADGNDSTFKRFRVNTIRLRNLMALHRVHSKNRLKSALRLAAMMLRFIALYLLIDAAQKRFSFPTVRAYLYGLVQIPVFLFWPFADFQAWYVALQEKMYASR
ncbi:glycosyltransferase family 2 protein [Planktotalea sp.]|uniref:glycosyltransferase family 2 protein n=1 Tax=Planktotalea sp. TaxID=2029877 RepID=UPI003D6AED0A